MNRLLILTFFLIPGGLSAQSNTLGPQVLSAGGGSGAQGNFELFWTIGEPIVQTVSNQQHILTQGFHQPDIFNQVSTWDLNLSALNIQVAPNPFVETFTLSLDHTADRRFAVQVYNTLGKAVTPIFDITNPTKQVIEARQWPAGTYYLTVLDRQSNKAATITLLRL